MGAETQHSVAWKPQSGPQTALLECPCFEVFFGGARGGGKTDGILGEFASHAALYGENAVGLMVRREITQLIETIERSKQIYSKIGWHYNEQAKLWRAPNGARLRFAYLERDRDADAYQGHSYTRVYIEEAGTFPSETPVLKLMATLRSGAGVPCGIRLTGNPGGPGQQWVKARYIDPCPSGWTVQRRSFENPFSGETVEREWVYIPSKVTDNEYLDDAYIANLQMVGSPKLVDAWLKGDWTAIEGAFFDCWSSEHVIRPFSIPEHWAKFRSGDWGSAKPFSIGWWAIASEDTKTPDGWIPRGAMIRYREWYGAEKDSNGNTVPNKGLKMHAEMVGQGVRKREGERVDYGVMDPSAFTRDGGPSIVERMGVYFRRADNKRVATKGALGGWDQMRARLEGEDFGKPMGHRPMIYCFDTCVDSIRTIPALQHDESRPEDVDTDMEDHAADEWRYACMSRPYVKEAPKDDNKFRDPYGFDEEEDNWKTA